MNPEEIARKYFYPGTRGYSILRYYYSKYKDLFARVLHLEFDEFLNEVLLNVSTIDFSKDIKSPEAYIIGTIKIQCRVQLDKAIKGKNRQIFHLPLSEDDSDDNESSHTDLPSDNPTPHAEIETQEVFWTVNQFKLTLKSSEVDLINNLIDEVPRKEIANNLQSNINTLDTQIRRLRIKFLNYLEKRGYSYNSIKRFKDK